jgi:hypothetical protein
MKAFGLGLFFLALAALLTASGSRAGVVHGTVVNRTTGKPVPNCLLELVNPAAGMQEVTSGKSDAQGQFTFDNPAIGAGPILIRATYSDVTFNTFLPPGRPDITAEVFEVSEDPKTITVTSHVVIFQPNGDKLIGAEEYIVQNNAQPAQAFFRPNGNFEFAIPEKGALNQVATTGSSGMPVTQATIERAKGHYAIAFAFRPGETSIRLSYELPYPGNATSVKLPAVYPDVKLLIVAPPGVTLTADGLQPAGQEQGMMVYGHLPLAPKASLGVMIAGVGFSPQSADSGSASGQPTPQEGNSRTGGEQIQAIPGRLDGLKWYLLGGFALLFAFSGFLLSRKQVVVTVGPATDGATEAAPAPKKKSAQSKPAPATPAAPSAAASVAGVEAAVNASLDSLKDQIFRLELRKQAGTISDEEYARERVRVEKLLRDLVQG